MDIANDIYIIFYKSVTGNPQMQTALSSPSISDSLLSPIFAAIAIFALFVTITTYIRTPNRKKLDWELVSDNKLLNISDVIKNRVQVLLDNRPIDDLCLVILKVWNSGNVSIHPSDFQNQLPMRFDFGGAEVLDADILETTSRFAKEEAVRCLKRSARTITLGPLLLKRKDAITLKILLTKHKAGKVNAKIKISGIKQVQAHVSVLEIPKRKLLIWSLIFIVVGQVLGYGMQYLLQPYNFPLLIKGLLFVVVLFFKSLSTSVFLFHGLLLIGLARGRMMKIKTMRDVFNYWIIISAITSIPTGVILTLSLMFSK